MATNTLQRYASRVAVSSYNGGKCDEYIRGKNNDSTQDVLRRGVALRLGKHVRQRRGLRRVVTGGCHRGRRRGEGVGVAGTGHLRGKSGRSRERRSGRRRRVAVVCDGRCGLGG